MSVISVCFGLGFFGVEGGVPTLSFVPAWVRGLMGSVDG